MRHHISTFIDAGERVYSVDRPNLDTTCLHIGASQFAVETLNIKGTPTDRAAFLRHMAEQLTAAADALAAVEVAS